MKKVHPTDSKLYHRKRQRLGEIPIHASSDGSALIRFARKKEIMNTAGHEASGEPRWQGILDCSPSVAGELDFVHDKPFSSLLLVRQIEAEWLVG